jgi:hypothetical protein
MALHKKCFHSVRVSGRLIVAQQFTAGIRAGKTGVRVSGRLIVAQQFTAGIRVGKIEVREADG